MENTKDNTGVNIRKVITMISILIAFTLTGTYAFLRLTAEQDTATAQAGCFEVNYSAQEISSASIVSTTNYLEGAHTEVTLSKNEDCEIYTKASIYIHTNDTTTAPLNTTPALKYKVLYSGTEISTGVITIESDDTLLATVDLTEDERVYDIYIWIDSDISLGAYDTKIYSGYIYAESIQSSTVKPLPSTLNAYATSIMVPIATSDASIDFYRPSASSDTNGVYIRSGTESDTYPIYYYRGNVNNNLIFADFCWKIVRTTETGGLKLIYNGVPNGTSCNNTEEAAIISEKEFNTNINSLAYVGYMYSSPYTSSSKDMNNITDAYVYGNDVTYSNGTYTLTDTISRTWSSVYNGGLNNNHYTCLSTGTTCSSVYYIYHTDSSTAYYITLTNGKKVEDALVDMLGADDNNTANYNTTSSTIKGNNTTEGTLDYWYYNNIEQKGYGSYIEDTVWCNDRSISSLGGWNPDGGDTRAYDLYFGAYERVWTNSSPSLSCSRNIDKFTVSDANGNGDLDYPVGLLTADEVMLAGAGVNHNMYSSYYLDNSYSFSSSPLYFRIDEGIISTANLSYEYDINYAFGVRPSISLKSGFSLTGDGDGTATNPYVVE